MTETIYFDTCALNRPSDDLTQPRIHAEAPAMARLFDLVAIGKLRLLDSAFLQFEVRRNSDLQRRMAALKLLSFAGEVAPTTLRVRLLAERLIALGFASIDALHLAAAQEAEAQAFFTTDDRLIRRASRLPEIVLVEVANSVDWLQRRFPWLLPRP